LSKQRLEGTQLFEAVDTQAEPTDVPNRKNLLVAVKETTTGHLSFGAGFSSVDSLLGFVEVTQGNFDLFNPPWFMGAGQKVRLRVQIGAKREDYELSFIEPWFLGKKLQLSVDLFHRDLRFVSVNDLYEERISGATIGLTRALGSDFLIGNVNYTIESVGIHNVPTNAPRELLQEEGTRLVSKVGLSLSYDTRNSALLPDRGQLTQVRTELAGGPFGGDSDFYKLEMRTSRYFKGFLHGHVLEINGGIGVVDSYGRSSRVPLFDRWYLGGIGDLRGYRYREVGPKDQPYVIRQLVPPNDGEAPHIVPSHNEPIGGSTYWVGTAEYSVPIIDYVRFAVFYDVGMVYVDPYSFRVQNKFNHFYNDNYGFGLRLNIPHLGPLRLDYGIPITSDLSNHSSGRFQFSVGYTRPF
jgi:outer membrane protein insertion porin family